MPKFQMKTEVIAQRDFFFLTCYQMSTHLDRSQRDGLSDVDTDVTVDN